MLILATIMGLFNTAPICPNYENQESWDYRQPDKCYFCQDHGDKIEEVRERLIYEGKLARIIADRSQSLTDSFVNRQTGEPLIAHLLVTPKRHIQSLADLSQEENSEILEIIKKAKQVFHHFYSDSYRPPEEQYEVNTFLLMLRDGPDAAQKVPHIHFHLLATRVRSPEEKEKDKTHFINGEYDPIQEIAKRRPMTKINHLLKEIELLRRVWQET